MHVFELHIGTAFNDDVVLDASEAKVHISNILWVITKHAHDCGPKRLNKPILLYQSASDHPHPPFEPVDPLRDWPTLHAEPEGT
jgi:hypothetical protein